MKKSPITEYSDKDEVINIILFKFDICWTLNP